MKKEKKDHVKHEKIAIAAFVITLILAGGAFYFVWKVNLGFGRTIEGLRDYACIQYQKENCPGEQCPCPDFTLYIPEKKQCCCDLPGEGRFSKYGIYVDVPIGADQITYTARCEEGCQKGGARVLNVGRCRWIDVS
ncbi:hypothetical protein HY489_01225 [Candidatus Woesearchaeota archaeon]|nr:hypothetical protein [Candidatus Woesearchaeota archaeon]